MYVRRNRNTPGLLVGRLVPRVVDFPPRQIGPFRCKVLALGVADVAGARVAPDWDVPVGDRRVELRRAATA